MPKESESSEQADRKIWGYTASERKERILEDLKDVSVSLHIMENSCPVSQRGTYRGLRTEVDGLQAIMEHGIKFEYAPRYSSKE